MVSFENLRKERIEEYRNPNKCFFDGTPQGTWKTGNSLGYSGQNNKITIVWLNTHNLIDEFFMDIGMNSLYGQLAEDLKLNYSVMFGQTFELSPFQQRIYELPKYVCSILENINKIYKGKIRYGDIANLKKSSLLVSNFCNELCPERYSCVYNYIKNNTFKGYERDGNYICFVPKAYIHTDFLGQLQNKYSDGTSIIDENTSNLMYNQFTFNPWSIENFIDFMNNKVIFTDPNIDSNSIWDEMEQLFDKIRSFIKGRKSLKISQKIINITDDLIDFIEKFDINQVKSWVEEVKQLLLDYNISVHNISNILIPLVEILDEINKIGKKSEIVKRINFDYPSKQFAFYKSRMERLQELVSGFKKNIFNDSMIEDQIIQHQFPEIYENQDYSLLKRENKAPWEKVFILNRNHAKDSKRNYSSNPKYELIKKKWKKGENPYKPKFFILLKLLMDVIRYELTQERYSVLIGTFKAFEERTMEDIDSKIKSSKLSKDIDHYYAIEGSNLYKKCEYGVLFCSAGKPKRAIKAEHSISGIPINILENIAGKGQMNQFAERLRPRLYPFQKRLYTFSNIVRGMFNNEMNFEGILQYKYDFIINFLAKNGWTPTEEIIELTKKSKSVTRDILKKLRKNGFVKWKTEGTGGRPLDLWNII